MTDKIIKQLEDEIKLLKKTIYELHKEVITHRQYFKQRADGEVSGYTTIPNLIPAAAEQVGRGNLLVIETSDGTKRAYLSELLGKLEVADIPDLDASKISTGTLNTDRLPIIPADNVPAAVNSATAGKGFGGFRYTVSGTTLNLFTS
ncbi:hypothetical protein ACOW85_001688 [Vibrio parahaemolyticus]